MTIAGWEDELNAGKGRMLGKVLKKPCGRVSSAGLRTFGLQIGKIVKRKGQSAARRRAMVRSRLHYDTRVAEHSERVQELENFGGRSNAEMEEILLAAIEAQNREEGTGAETLKIELPAEFTAAHRAEFMNVLEQWFEERGYRVHWAVHSHNEENEYQPHAHMTYTKRPVNFIDGKWVGQGGGNRKLGKGPPAAMDGSDAIAQFRVLIASNVNRIANRDGIKLSGVWHEGGFKDIGIDREPKRRVPVGAFKGKLTPREKGPGWANEMIDAGRVDLVQAERKAWGKVQQEKRHAILDGREQKRAQSRQRQMDGLNAVPKSAMAFVEAIASDVQIAAMIAANDAKAARIERDAMSPATSNQIGLLVTMMAERGVTMPDSDEPITVAVFAALKDQLKAMPKIQQQAAPELAPPQLPLPDPVAVHQDARQRLSEWLAKKDAKGKTWSEKLEQARQIAAAPDAVCKDTMTVMAEWERKPLKPGEDVWTRAENEAKRLANAAAKQPGQRQIAVQIIERHRQLATAVETARQALPQVSKQPVQGKPQPQRPKGKGGAEME